MKKAKPMNEHQKAIIAMHGLDYREFELVKDLPNSLIVRSILDGTYQVLEQNLPGRPR